MYNNYNLAVFEDVAELKNDLLKQNLENKLLQGFETSLNIKADCTYEAVSKQAFGLMKYRDIDGKTDSDIVGFMDYNNQAQYITFAQYKQLIKETSDYYYANWMAYWEKRSLIENCTTIEELNNLDLTI